MNLAILANSENRRCQFFLEAAKCLGIRNVVVVPWIDYLSGDIEFSNLDLLRIESPGENFDVERQFIVRGAELAAQEPQFSHIDESAARVLARDLGRIRFQRQWQHGWSLTLREIADRIRQLPNLRVMNPPADIELMFDKWAAQQHLENHGVATPERIGLISSFEDLMSWIGENARVFLKPAHSSSASGVVALQVRRGRILATTPVEIVREGGEIRLYNTLRIRRYTDLGDVRDVIDTLSRERIFAEQWFPKAGLDGGTFDLRILVVAGQAAHAVARQSQSPITNLHLGNARGNLDEVKEKLGESGWREAEAVCESAAAAFPDSHYVAVDLMVSSNFKNFAVAETNAFGDLLPNLEFNGDDSYTFELRRWLEKL
ncbi:MAG: STM4014 family protein [Verrucomicrobiota bacterium]